MKIWSTPHSDMGVTGTITVNLAVVKLGYMLERPSILHYSFMVTGRMYALVVMSSDNVDRWGSWSRKLQGREP